MEKKKLLLCWWWVVPLNCLTCCCLESVFASSTPHLQYLLCKIKCWLTLVYIQTLDDEMLTHRLKWQMIYFVEQCCTWHFKKINSWQLCTRRPSLKQNFKTQTDKPCGIKRGNLNTYTDLWGYTCMLWCANASNHWAGSVAEVSSWVLLGCCSWEL